MADDNTETPTADAPDAKTVETVPEKPATEKATTPGTEPPAPEPKEQEPPPAAEKSKPKTTEPPEKPKDESPPDWRGSIADSKLRNVADRFASPTDMTQAVVDLRGQLSQRVKVPGEGTNDEDVAKFRKAIGVPEKAEDYAVTLPEGVEMSEVDNALLDAVRPIAYEHGVPAEAFNGFVAKYKEMSDAIQRDTIEQLDKFRRDSETDLQREWGADYKPNLTLANRVAEIAGGPQFQAFISETPLASGGMLGDHPVLVRFLATLGRRMDEGDLMIGATHEEKAGIQEQINELNAKVPPGSPEYKTAAHQAKLTKFYEQLYGNAQIVGVSQRVA